MSKTVSRETTSMTLFKRRIDNYLSTSTSTSSSSTTSTARMLHLWLGLAVVLFLVVAVLLLLLGRRLFGFLRLFAWHRVVSNAVLLSCFLVMSFVLCEQGIIIEDEPCCQVSSRNENKDVTPSSHSRKMWKRSKIGGPGATHYCRVQWKVR